MTKTIKEINEFIYKLDKNHFNDDYSSYMTDFLTDDFLEELDQQDPAKCFEDIQEKLEENYFFNVEVIYHYDAMKYLTENDQSLQESIQIAVDHGFTLESINSEILASLLASQNVRETFCYLRDQIIEFFED